MKSRFLWRPVPNKAVCRCSPCITHTCVFSFWLIRPTYLLNLRDIHTYIYLYICTKTINSQSWVIVVVMIMQRNATESNAMWCGMVRYMYIYICIYICRYIYVCTLNPCNYMRWRVHRHVFCHLIFFGHWLSEKQFRQRPDMYFDMSTDMYSDISACWPTLVLIRILTPTLTLYIYIFIW